MPHIPRQLLSRNPIALKFPPLTIPHPHQGPLLGDKTTITAITEQYAKADPIYVDKTIVSIPFRSPALSVLAGPVVKWQSCSSADDHTGSTTDVLTLQTRQRRRQLWLER